MLAVIANIGGNNIKYPTDCTQCACQWQWFYGNESSGKFNDVLSHTSVGWSGYRADSTNDALFQYVFLNRTICIYSSADFDNSVDYTSEIKANYSRSIEDNLSATEYLFNMNLAA